MLKHVPNILTIIRFCLIPVIIVLLIQQNYILAFIVLTLSGITDILDGTIARKFNLITNFGKLMDPLADKATQVAILIVLVVQSVIPFWILLVVIVKEFLMVSGASFLYGKEFVVSSKWYGKLATVIFYVAIVSSLFIAQFNTNLLNHPEYSMSFLPNFDLYLYYLGLAATLFSLFMYIKAYYMQGYLKKENLKIEDKNKK